MDVNFEIIPGDIVDVTAQAIVNAANTELQTGGGGDGAIRKAAGEEKLQKELDTVKKIFQRGHLPPGQAVITGAHDMETCEYIIHTVAPICFDKRPVTRTQEKNQLRSCYLGSLAVCEADNIKSVAFPLLGAGAYKYPMKKALFVAVQAILTHFEARSSSVLKKVSLVLMGSAMKYATTALKDLMQLRLAHSMAAGGYRVLLESRNVKKKNCIKITDGQIWNLRQRLG